MKTTNLLQGSKIKQVELAKKLNITPAHLNSVFRGRLRPSILLALAIERETGGLIKAVSLRKELEQIAV
jgi:DNA-binding transcriptional regulator YdaS (Cro superfamily)